MKYTIEDNPRSNCKLTGVMITPLTLDELLAYIGSQITSARPSVIVGHNLHSAYLYHTDSEFREFYRNAAVVLADGAPIKWDFRFSGGREGIDRLGSTDWIPKLHSISGLARISVIGASEVSNRKFVTWLQELLPNVEIEGTSGSNWNPLLASSVLARLHVFKPQIVLVGIGMPNQEFFGAQILKSGLVATVATVGGAIDQLSGEQKNAPRWTGRFGLEWLWRLATQPKRLWRRYLIEPWKLLWVRLRSRGRLD